MRGDQNSGKLFTVILRENMLMNQNSTLNDTKLKIYPNPVLHELSIELDSQIKDDLFELSIIDALGQVKMLRSNLSRYDLEKIRVDLLSSGTYFLEIKGDGFLISSSFIKIAE